MDKDRSSSQDPQRVYTTKFAEVVGAKETRKALARKHDKKSIWFGLGMFGIVGWSVAVPTLVGAAIGIWIDSRYPSRFSWTLMLLFAGVLFGSINAWYWINRVGKNG